jgi:hypothetical protein
LVTVLDVVPSLAVRAEVVSRTLPVLSVSVLDTWKPSDVFAPVTVLVRLFPSGVVLVMVEV